MSVSPSFLPETTPRPNFDVTHPVSERTRTCRFGEASEAFDLSPLWWKEEGRPDEERVPSRSWLGFETTGVWNRVPGERY